MGKNAKQPDWSRLAERLTAALDLSSAPIFLAFGEEDSPAPAFSKPMSPPAEDGRRKRVPASWVFWVEAGLNGAFSTVAADHANCSVGLFTHGFAELDPSKADVGALLEGGWVTPEMLPAIPSVTKRPASITYGRLEDVPDGVEPDVVMLRVNGRQLMVLSDSLPGLLIEGEPQCHIVALAKEQGRPAASVGCALSRAGTAFRPEEMSCALPAAELACLVRLIEETAASDSVVAKFAAEEARRFAVS